jgi:hypothetical protein
MSSNHILSLIKEVMTRPLQYLQSPNLDIENADDGGKTTIYFFPSMVFPTYIELVSATLMYNNKKSGSTDKIIQLATSENGGSDKPIDRKEYNLLHKAGELVTTLKFNPSLLLDPHQSFYFYSLEELKDSSMVLGYRICNGNFGDRIQTPLNH